MSPLLALSNSLADTVAATETSIVAIKTGQRVSPSGVHWRKGIIITSDESLQNHEDLTILNNSGKSSPISLLGRAPTTDIAVFTLADAETLPVATVGNSRMLRAYLTRCQKHIQPQNLDMTIFILSRTVEALCHAAAIEQPDFVNNSHFEQEISSLLLLYLKGSKPQA
jgi:Tetracyclin repressor-like, C-terminal domain